MQCSPIIWIFVCINQYSISKYNEIPQSHLYRSLNYRENRIDYFTVGFKVVIMKRKAVNCLQCVTAWSVGPDVDHVAQNDARGRSMRFLRSLRTFSAGTEHASGLNLQPWEPGRACAWKNCKDKPASEMWWQGGIYKRRLVLWARVFHGVCGS